MQHFESTSTTAYRRKGKAFHIHTTVRTPYRLNFHWLMRSKHLNNEKIIPSNSECHYQNINNVIAYVNSVTFQTGRLMIILHGGGGHGSRCGGSLQVTTETVKVVLMEEIMVPIFVGVVRHDIDGW